MPRNYQNSVIYKLVNSIDDNIYIGSTTANVKKRISSHRSSSKRNPMRLVYKHINNIGWENVNIIIIERYPCIDKYDLESRECFWIQKLKPSLNVNTPTMTFPCEHKNIKSNCVHCKGTNICIHNKQKNWCSICNAEYVCEHKVVKFACYECKNSFAYCEQCDVIIPKLRIDTHNLSQFHMRGKQDKEEIMREMEALFM